MAERGTWVEPQGTLLADAAAELASQPMSYYKSKSQKALPLWTLPNNKTADDVGELTSLTAKRAFAGGKISLAYNATALGSASKAVMTLGNFALYSLNNCATWSRGRRKPNPNETWLARLPKTCRCQNQKLVDGGVHTCLLQEQPLVGLDVPAKASHLFSRNAIFQI
jgi:hypothetical protein